METSEETTQVVECTECRNADENADVSFLCRRRRANLCDTCVPEQLRDKSKTGHDVIANMDVDGRITEQEVSKMYNKIDELIKSIAQNDRLQSSRDELGTRFGYTTKQLFTFIFIIILSIVIYFIYQKGKSEVTAQREELQKLIDDYLKKQHMIDLKRGFEEVLQKQVKEFEELIKKLEQKASPATVTVREFLKMPSVSFAINTGFPAQEENNNRLFDMAVTDDKKVWMGGNSRELKLFDLQGNLHRTATITWFGYYICMYNKHVVFIDQPNKAVKKVSDDATVVTMFKTGEWVPYGITGSASGDLLVCLRKVHQSKVVRYSSTGTVLQEIQYDSQGKPLYQHAWYIAENVNGDIIVSDRERKVTAVNKLGIFRYSYSGEKSSLISSQKVVTDSVGHILVADCSGSKVHLLDRDGRFIRYIISKEGLDCPRGLAMIDDNEVIVGECLTGFAKMIIFLEEKNML